MNILKKLTMFTAGLIALTASASALTIVGPNPHYNIASGDPDPLYWGNEGNTDDIEAILATKGININELYKSDVGRGSAGIDDPAAPFANSYNTTFNADRSGAVISVQSGGTSPLPLAIYYLLVKDGNANPDWYVYAINWNGVESITLSGFWANTAGQDIGEISHVSIYGGPQSVPDGGATAALLGVGLLALAGLRRKS